MRKLLILAIVLSLAGLAPAPIFACAFSSSTMTECFAPKTHSCCPKLQMGQATMKLAAASDMSCCSVDAPLPQTQYNAPEPPLLAATTAITQTPAAIPGIPEEQSADAAQDYSPPPLQSLLCTFLI